MVWLSLHVNKNPTNPSEEARYALDLYPSIQRKTHCSNHHVLSPLPLIINPSLSSSPHHQPPHHTSQHHKEEEKEKMGSLKRKKPYLSFPLILFYYGWSERLLFYSASLSHLLSGNWSILVRLFARFSKSTCLFQLLSVWVSLFLHLKLSELMVHTIWALV